MAVGDWWIGYEEGDFIDGGHANRDAAILAGYSMFSGESFYVGEEQDTWAIIEGYDCANELIEKLDCRLYDYVGGDGFNITMPKDRIKELDAIIKKFLKKHATISRCHIEQVEKIIPQAIEGDALKQGHHE